MVVDCPQKRPNEPGRRRTEAVLKQFQNVIVCVWRFLLNRRSDSGPMSKNILAGGVRLIWVEEDRMGWSANVRMTGR